MVVQHSLGVRLRRAMCAHTGSMGWPAFVRFAVWLALSLAVYCMYSVHKAAAKARYLPVQAAQTRWGGTPPDTAFVPRRAHPYILCSVTHKMSTQHPIIYVMYRGDSTFADCIYCSLQIVGGQ